MCTYKILVVDDEVIHIEAIMDCIEETGNDYSVMQAFTGDNAFEIAQKVIPDLEWHRINKETEKL